MANKFGSITNIVLANVEDQVPEVGMGATYVLWTDRMPCTITWVSEDKKKIKVRTDKSVRIDSRGADESQEYEFFPDPNGDEFTAKLTKRGWISCGKKFLIGWRKRYYDYSF
jgi:hypothetical protein